MHKRKFPLDFCLKSGVLKKTDRDSVRDYFYHRVIFPNLKRRRVVHISARSLDGQEPKYLHLPGEMHYLYNEDALSNRAVYIVEGIPDCLSAVQAGYPAVAILGSSNFKPEYLLKFSRCETVYLCLDGDKAGEEGALKIGGLIGERARIVQIVQLPKGLDLNDYLKVHTKEDFKSLVDSAKDIIKYELNLIPPDTDKTKLPRMLDPVLMQLAHMEKANAEAYLSYEIKPRFKLKKDDIDGYRVIIKKHRKTESNIKRHHEDRDDKTGSTAPIFNAIFAGLVDIVTDSADGEVVYLVKQNDTSAELREVEINGTVYVPPAKEHLPFELPRAAEVLKWYTSDNNAQLFRDVLTYLKRFSYLPDKQWLIVACVVFLSYIQENADIHYLPELLFYAVPERGKSRTGKAVTYIAYRGVHTLELREANLFRFSNDLGATIFFDVMNLWRKAERNNCEDIMLGRYEKGQTVARVIFPEKGAFRDTRHYKVYGATLIATNESLHNILDTRCIPITMPNKPDRYENPTPAKAQEIKERLTAWRARMIDVPIPTIEPVQGLNGRLWDITDPLLRLCKTVYPEVLVILKEALLGVARARIEDKAQTIEGKIVTIIVSLSPAGMDTCEIWTSQVLDKLNEDRPEGHKYTAQRLTDS
jgi:hypothetical protein